MRYLLLYCIRNCSRNVQLFRLYLIQTVLVETHEMSFNTMYHVFKIIFSHPLLQLEYNVPEHENSESG